MKKNFIKIYPILFFCFIFFVNNANGSQLKSVFEKSRFYDNNESLRSGSVKWKFNTDISSTHNDNIYATKDDKKEDWVYNVKPYVEFESDWTRHELYLNANLDAGIYDEYSDENYLDRSLNGGGRIDFTKSTNLEYKASYNYLHEERGLPDDTNGIEPTEYTFINYSTKLNYAQKSRVRGYVETNIDSYNYEHDYRRVSSTDQTLVKIDNKYRKRNVYKGATRLDYEFIPDYTIFVLGSLNEVDYRDNTRDGVYNLKDSKGYETRVGGTYNLTGKIDSEIYAGYLSQDYRNDDLEDVSGYYGGGSILWNATGLTSLRTGARRSVKETTVTNASSYLLTEYNSSIEHELTKDILLSFGYNIINYDFQYKQSGLHRKDDAEVFEIIGRYYINRNFLFEAGYYYEDNESSSLDGNYDLSKTYFKLQYKL